ncbi:MAG: response regulator [archaeon]
MKTVLVVDDDQGIRDTVKAIIEKAGYRVVLGIDGDDCLRKVESEKPDLILLDIQMPGTPVRKIVRQVHKIKVIYLTGMQESDAEKLGLLDSENVVGFVKKTFNVADLIRTVKEILD